MTSMAAIHFSHQMVVIVAYGCFVILTILLLTEQPLRPNVYSEERHIVDERHHRFISARAHTGNARDVNLGDYFVLGITTVARNKADYLNQTLFSLQCGLQSDSATPNVVVLNGEVPAAKHSSFQNLWRSASMQQFMRNGLILVTFEALHSELQAANATGGLPRTHGDSPERVWWRSKHNLDTAYLMEAALHISPKAQYYLQIEDDVRLAPHFLSILHRYLQDKHKQGDAADIVGLFDAGGFMGGVAVAYRVGSLRQLVSYLRSNYFQSPVDWLITDFSKQNNLSSHIMRPNLVQHTGVMSSLVGKIQKLASTTFNSSGTC